MLTSLAGRRIPARGTDVLHPGTTALLLWDLQVGLAGQSPALTTLAPCWVKLIEAARQHGVLIVWTRHIAPPPPLMDDPEIWRVMRKQKVSRPEDLKPYMQAASGDTEFITGFTPGQDDLVITKSTPSLFYGTMAESRLRTAGIKALLMAGVATDIGIEFTARDALVRGIFPVVVRDGVGSYTEKAQARGLACLDAFAFLETSDDLIEALSAQKISR